MDSDSELQPLGQLGQGSGRASSSKPPRQSYGRGPVIAAASVTAPPAVVPVTRAIVDFYQRIW